MGALILAKGYEMSFMNPLYELGALIVRSFDEFECMELTSLSRMRSMTPLQGMGLLMATGLRLCALSRTWSFFLFGRSSSSPHSSTSLEESS